MLIMPLDSVGCACRCIANTVRLHDIIVMLRKIAKVHQKYTPAQY